MCCARSEGACPPSYPISRLLFIDRAMPCCSPSCSHNRYSNQLPTVRANQCQVRETQCSGAEARGGQSLPQALVVQQRTTEVDGNVVLRAS